MKFSGEVTALIGVAVGAALSYVATYLSERASWRRSQAVRWDKRRLAAYADYGYAIKHVVNLASRIAAGRGLEKVPEPLESSAENLTKLAEAEVNRSVSAETLRLLGDPTTGLASERLTVCAWTLSWMARGIIESDQDSWKNAIIAYAKARDEYIMSARQSLGMRGSQTPTLMPAMAFEKELTKSVNQANRYEAKDAQAGPLV